MTKKLISFLLGTRFFTSLALVFALYVSAFFVFNRQLTLQEFISDFRVHGIILCAMLSILSGSIINHFYDDHRDRILQPLRHKLQSFLSLKTFLHAYLAINILCFAIALYISWRVFLFYFIYQILIWAYSHKFSRILIINNISFVVLSLYPFFGMLFYFRAYHTSLFLHTAYLFCLLLLMDILKDLLSYRADAIYHYQTIPLVFSVPKVSLILHTICYVCAVICILLLQSLSPEFSFYWYFLLGSLGAIVLPNMLYQSKEKFKRKRIFKLLIFLKIWLIIGLISICTDAIILP